MRIQVKANVNVRLKGRALAPKHFVSHKYFKVGKERKVTTLKMETSKNGFC